MVGVSPWLSLLPHLRPHRVALATVTAVGLSAAGAGLALPLVARQLVDNLSARQPVLAAVALLVALTLTTAALNGISAYLLTRIAESFVLGVRRTLISHL